MENVSLQMTFWPLTSPSQLPIWLYGSMPEPLGPDLWRRLHQRVQWQRVSQCAGDDHSCYTPSEVGSVHEQEKSRSDVYTLLLIKTTCENKCVMSLWLWRELFKVYKYNTDENGKHEFLCFCMKSNLGQKFYYFEKMICDWKTRILNCIQIFILNFQKRLHVFK